MIILSSFALLAYGNENVEENDSVTSLFQESLQSSYEEFTQYSKKQASKIFHVLKNLRITSVTLDVPYASYLSEQKKKPDENILKQHATAAMQTFLGAIFGGEIHEKEKRKELRDLTKKYPTGTVGAAIYVANEIFDRLYIFGDEGAEGVIEIAKNNPNILTQSSDDAHEEFQRLETAYNKNKINIGGYRNWPSNIVAVIDTPMRTKLSKFLSSLREFDNEEAQKRLLENIAKSEEAAKDFLLKMQLANGHTEEIVVGIDNSVTMSYWYDDTPIESEGETKSLKDLISDIISSPEESAILTFAGVRHPMTGKIYDFQEEHTQWSTEFRERLEKFQNNDKQWIEEFEKRLKKYTPFGYNSPDFKFLSGTKPYEDIRFNLEKAHENSNKILTDIHEKVKALGARESNSFHSREGRESGGGFHRDRHERGSGFGRVIGSFERTSNGVTERGAIHEHRGSWERTRDEL